jgi:hypothetical protein
MERLRRSSLAAVVCLLLLALAAPVAGAAPVFVPGPGWTGPTAVATGDYWTVRYGVDNDGFSHVVFLAENGLYYQTNHPSGTWTTTKLWTEKKGYQDDLDVRVDGGGSVYIAWAKPYHGIQYLTNVNGGPNAGWPTTPTLLVGGNAREPSLRLVDYKVHLAWVQARQVWYGTDTSGTWTRTAVSPKGWVGRPSLIVHPAKTARIAYESAKGITYAVNTGTTLAPTFSREIIPGSSGGFGASLAIDSALQPHVAWLYQTPVCALRCASLRARLTFPDGTYYAVKGASGWTPKAKQRISTESSDVPQLVLDASDQFHLWDGRHVISDASGSIARPVVARGYDHGTVGLDVTAAGKGRLVFADQKDGAERLFLMTEQ